MDQLLVNIGTLIVGAGSIIVYSFRTFATKDEAAQHKQDSKDEISELKKEFKDLKGDMDKRLERIENKLDRLIEKGI